MSSTGDTAQRSKGVGEFRERPSYLHELYERSQHARSLYNLSWLMFILLVAQAMWQDYVLETGLLRVASVISDSFSPLPYGLACWLALHAAVLLLLYGFRLWAWLHRKIKANGIFRKLLNFSAVGLFVAIQLANFAVALTVCRKLDFKFALRFAIHSETIRLMLKMHAFVRSNAGSVVACHSMEPHDEWQPPSWRHYLYYLFAPTLVYSDSYTRSATPRGPLKWSSIFWGLAEIAAFIVLAAIYYSRLVHPYFADFGRQTPLDFRQIGDAIFHMALPTFPITFLTFYVLLHSVQNVFAELLNFGDRQFYTQWWCSASLAEFYQRENAIIQTFIHVYVYTDLKQLPVFRGRRWLTSLATISLSAIFHDYMGVATVRVCLPVFFILMLAASIFTPLAAWTPKGVGNYLMLAAIFVGSSVIFTAYFMEIYAQRNCQREDMGFFDSLVPHIYTCFTKAGGSH